MAEEGKNKYESKYNWEEYGMLNSCVNPNLMTRVLDITVHQMDKLNLMNCSITIPTIHTLFRNKTTNYSNNFIKSKVLKVVTHINSNETQQLYRDLTTNTYAIIFAECELCSYISKKLEWIEN